MKIRVAMQETGMAYFPSEGKDDFVSIDLGGVVKWKNGEDVMLAHIADDGWQPYHEEKEIRPEMAGELWREEGGNMWATRPSGTKGEISIGCISTWGSSWCKYAVNAWHGKIIHGKDGWKRVIPPVEDESVERIEVMPEMYQGHKDVGTDYLIRLPLGYYDKIDGMKCLLEVTKKK